jgi:hypothetical protein
MCGKTANRFLKFLKKGKIRQYVDHQVFAYILITIENSRFIRGNLFSNKYLPFYSREFTTLKGILPQKRKG